jgi:hypothetical protein
LGSRNSSEISRHSRVRPDWNLISSEIVTDDVVLFHSVFDIKTMTSGVIGSVSRNQCVVGAMNGVTTVVRYVDRTVGDITKEGVGMDVRFGRHYCNQQERRYNQLTSQERIASYGNGKDNEPFDFFDPFCIPTPL